MSFHPWEALTGAIVIPALVILIPIHVAALFNMIDRLADALGWDVPPFTAFRERAADMLRRAVRLQPQGLWPHFYEGVCAYRLGRYDDAMVYWRQGLAASRATVISVGAFLSHQRA